MASVYRKRGRYYARFKDAAGRWRHQITACQTKRDAERFAADLERRAERCRSGLEPLPSDAPKMTFGELYDWWWDEYGSKRRGRRNEDNDQFNRKRLVPPLANLALMEVTTGRIEGLLQGLTDDLSPRSLNMLRATAYTVFAKATKRNLWHGQNPAAGVDRRAVPKKVHETLRAEEVPFLLMHLDRKWRGIFACAVWTGLRKGEILGLRKSDVDLRDGTLTVRHSYEAETTKGNHADVIPIAEPLRPWLAEAIDQSPSQFVFPSPDGSMYPDDLPLQEVLRRALGRAGVVIGFQNVCRRKNCGFGEESKESSRRPCPQCDFKLWPKAIPRPLRFHDLRGTTGTLLARAGVPLVVAQRILRHSDPRLTANIYSHVGFG